MKNKYWMLALTLGGFVAACDRMQDTRASAPGPGLPADYDDDEFEEVVSIDEVPAAAMQAALAAVAGFVPSEAEREIAGDSLRYCIHGNVGEEFVEVEVTPEGEVLEIERSEYEDEDEEDDDDDD